MLKKSVILVLVAAFGAGLLATTQALSQEEKQPGMPEMDMAQMMEMYAKYNAPGEPHARFKDVVGIWETESKMWMGPGEPTVSQGKSKMQLLLDGRYLMEHYLCSSPEMPFEGIGINGYDNHTKKYFSIWLDSMSTGYVVMEGTRDETTKTTTYLGEYDDPFMGHSKVKSTMCEVSDDKCVLKMYRVLPDGKEQQSMEVTYTRSPAS